MSDSVETEALRCALRRGSRSDAVVDINDSAFVYTAQTV